MREIKIKIRKTHALYYLFSVADVIAVAVDTFVDDGGVYY